MPSTSQIEAEQQRLYESGSLRDDLNDEEATVLLQWGESQIVRLSEQVADDDFEKQCRFLRQLIKSINRFVGQREFNDRNGQLDYLSKVEKWLPKVEGFREVSAEAILAKLPEQTEMMVDLKIVLEMISPSQTMQTPPSQDTAPPADTPDMDKHTQSSDTPERITAVMANRSVSAGSGSAADTVEKPSITDFLPLDDEPVLTSPDDEPVEPSQPESNFLSSIFDRLTQEDDGHDETE